ncbi:MULTISPECIES: phosphatidylinositol kinase [Vibrio]|uniref:phosphatidylinositol kinase n=1 Tax=Vibrio TaxID=662 RepID=UPI001BD3B897|nr:MULTISPECIES: phosphatidylinositol kinase [Vibrio]MBS9812034.1 phosphatidylinositol kinase [Vibrio alginolyticus]MDW1568345.1 phosphatidylinositol kinase [Vibrio sp. YT-15]MDW3115401.1 phosphatidylinositol kinase [Vibrio sp. 1727]
MMKSKKVIISRFQKRYNTYLQLLLDIRGELGWSFRDSDKSEMFTVPFILTLAAALECSLNDHLIEHFDDEFGDSSKQLLPGLLSMNFKGKLINIVPTLTQYKYKLNTNHKVYALLVELIKLRNSLVHNKSDYDEKEISIHKDESGQVHGLNYEELKSFTKVEHDYSFGVKADVGAIHDAVEQFHELFLECYRDKAFTGNDLIIPLVANDQIKLVFAD